MHEAAALGRVGIDVGEGGKALRHRRLAMHRDRVARLRRRGVRQDRQARRSAATRRRMVLAGCDQQHMGGASRWVVQRNPTRLCRRDGGHRAARFDDNSAARVLAAGGQQFANLAIESAAMVSSLSALLLRGATAAALIGAAPAIGQPSAPGQPPAAPVQSGKLVYSPWTKFCTTPPPTSRSCRHLLHRA